MELSRRSLLGTLMGAVAGVGYIAKEGLDLFRDLRDKPQEAISLEGDKQDQRHEGQMRTFKELYGPEKECRICTKPFHPEERKFTFLDFYKEARQPRGEKGGTPKIEIVLTSSPAQCCEHCWVTFANRRRNDINFSDLTAQEKLVYDHYIMRLHRNIRHVRPA